MRDGYFRNEGLCTEVQPLWLFGMLHKGTKLLICSDAVRTVMCMPVVVVEDSELRDESTMAVSVP
jgi:hypothetical protein